MLARIDPAATATTRYATISRMRSTQPILSNKSAITRPIGHASVATRSLFINGLIEGEANLRIDELEHHDADLFVFVRDLLAGSWDIRCASRPAFVCIMVRHQPYATERNPDHTVGGRVGRFQNTDDVVLSIVLFRLIEIHAVVGMDEVSANFQMHLLSNEAADDGFPSIAQAHR